MEKWLDKQREGEWGALQEHTDILKNLFRGKISTETAAKEVFESVKSKTTPSDAAYRFSQLVLDTASEFQATQEPIVALLRDIHEVNLAPNKVLDDFNMYLREQLDSLEGRRYFSEPESEDQLETSAGSSGAVTPGDRWVNFNVFYANLAFHAAFASDGAIFGFFRLRDLLEYSSETREQKRHEMLKAAPFKKAPPISMEKLTEYDIKAAVCWVSSVLYDTQNSLFGDYWARGLAVQTDFWTAEPGLSKGRWQLWKERLERIAERDDFHLHRSVKEAAADAAAAIGAFGEEVTSAAQG